MKIIDKADGQEYPIDPSRLTWAEGDFLERQLGMLLPEFADGIGKGSTRCKRGLAFVAMKRRQPGIKWTDLDSRAFNDFEFDDSEERAALKAEQERAAAEGRTDPPAVAAAGEETPPA